MNITNEGITITGVAEFEAAIKRLETTNPGFEKRVRSVIRKVMSSAKSALSKDAKTSLQMKSDPRHAYKAVRYAVYKRLLGGQVNILSQRHAGTETNYTPPRTLVEGKRGGNRRQRTSRNLDKYEGRDRGFILRWLNAGTEERNVEFKTNAKRHEDKWNHHPNTGYRGHIVARNWFGPASLRELQQAAAQMQTLIDQVINEEFA